MKIRKDFVTNSSSSSFIIGKKEDESVTIESVYQTVRGLYKELLAKRDELIEYIKANPKLKLEYHEYPDENYATFGFKNGGVKDDYDGSINRTIKKQFGIDTWDSFDADYGWLDCETYQEYESYWIQKMKESKSYKIYAPFTIGDFLEEKKINWLHWNQYVKDEYDSEDVDDIHCINSKSNVLGWYFPYAEEAFDTELSCETCRNNNWCEVKEKIKCQSCSAEIREKAIPEDKACLYLLGRVCIYSESGYINNYVVERLSEISEYSCNHMG